MRKVSLELDICFLSTPFSFGHFCKELYMEFGIHTFDTFKVR